MKSPIRVLAIDGGGIGGIVPARILQRLQDQFPDVIKNTDLFAGTSTGGLIALGLAKGMTPAEMCDVYLKQGPDIFSVANRRFVAQRPFLAKYVPSGLKKVVDSIFQNKVVGELAKPVLVPVTAIERSDKAHTPAGIFVSTAYRLIDKGSTFEKYDSSKWRCADVALATAAAPTYFPAHSVEMSGGKQWLCWDGGIVANNPALASVGEIYRLLLAEESQEVRKNVGEHLPDICVLSLGTGYKNSPVHAGDWGLLQCARPIVSTLLDASVGSTAFLTRQIIGERAIRVSPPLTLDYEMDDPSRLSQLDKLARTFDLHNIAQPDNTRADLIAWMKRFWA